MSAKPPEERPNDITRIVLLDTRTGKKCELIQDPPISYWWWSQGNGSCDCNRAIQFWQEGDSEDRDYEEEQRIALGLDEGVCLGDKRWLIVECDTRSGRLTNAETRELNDNYPSELVEKFLPV